MKFKEIPNISKFILDGLNRLGFEETTEIQEKCIPSIMQKLDVIGKSQTGSGKTFAYGIPALECVDLEEDEVQVLVVCPTRELVSQVCEELRKLTKFNDARKVVPIFGGANMDRQKTALKNGAKIVVGTPGRLMDHLRRKTLKLHNLKMVVLDEADEMLNMGFKEDIEAILKTTNTTHQTVMFSATMPKPILSLTKEFMKEPIFVELSQNNEPANNIKQYYVDGDKKTILLKLLEEYKPNLAIVFCNTKRMVDEATDFLTENKHKAIAIHGDMRQSNRKKSMDSLKKGTSNILVATDVAARGIDIKNIDIVFNYDIPNDVEYYVHRIGRTGRAGQSGISITFVNTKKQREQLVDIMNQTAKNIEELSIEGVISPKNLLNSIEKSTNNFKRNDRNARSCGGRNGKSFGSNSNSRKPREFGDRKPRDFADRKPRDFGEKKQREYSDRRPKEFGARKENGFSDKRKSFGKQKEYTDRKPREYADRKPRDFDKKKESGFDSRKKDNRNKSEFGDKRKRQNEFGDKKKFGGFKNEKPNRNKR
ncbi:MAG: DEAD/DEAH box helicase [Clostridia bacterium]|nr:DEAD/DEAH box helicase [Clostridia bacterium]